MRRTLFSVLLLSACDDTVFGVQEVVTTEGYEGVVAIADARCVGCHSAASAQGGLDLETDLHGSTVGVVGAYGVVIVEPGDPGASMLFRKVTNTQGANEGVDMPIGSGGLDAAEADLIEAWILDGALAE